MYRYFAFVKKPGHELAAASKIASCLERLLSPKGQYRKIYESEHIIVLDAPHFSSKLSACLLQPDQGVILGTLFPAHGGQAADRLPPEESAVIAATDGRRLTEDYWGRYIAFLHTTDGVSIIADPIGGLDVFWYEDTEFTCIFSSAADFASLELARLSIRWEHVAAHLRSPLECQPTTGLAPIRKILPGKGLKISREGITEKKYWGLRQVADQEPLSTLDQAAECLRDAMLRSAQAWATRYERFLLLLSGGLDSAIVLGCLKNAADRENILCVNYYSHRPESDERFYARRTAQLAGVELLEIEDRQETVDLSLITRFWQSAEPVLALEDVVRGPRRFDLAQQFGAHAMLDGHNGDGIFGKPLTSGATDFLWAIGFRTGLWRTAIETARLRRTTVWSVLSTAFFIRATRKQNFYLGSPDKEYLGTLDSLFPPSATSAIETDPGTTPHFFRTIPPGKVLHCQLMDVPNRPFWPGLPEWSLESVHPIISQPVIEAACRIPTHLLNHGGRSRGLARYAFQDLLPSEIVYRQSKGGVVDFAEKVFVQNYKFLREFFLDGVLVSEGLIARSTVEQAFSSRLGQGSVVRNLLLSALSAEAWARHWRCFTR